MPGILPALLQVVAPLKVQLAGLWLLGNDRFVGWEGWIREVKGWFLETAVWPQVVYSSCHISPALFTGVLNVDYVGKGLHTHTHTHTYTHAHTCTQTYTCTHTHTHNTYTQIHTRTHTHNTHTCTHVHTNIYTHTYTHTHVYTHARTHVYTHIVPAHS
jgi:hypothetical protein